MSVRESERRLNRPENVRVIPPSDPDFSSLYARRNDAESINRALDDSLWDAVLRLDGHLTGGAKSGNRPLADLIRALPGLTTTPLADERRKRITGLAEDLRRIAWDYPDDVNEIRFHVYGVRGVTSGANFDGYRHLVIAPFLNEKGIAKVAPDSSDAAVVSRVENLDRLSPETAARITPYIVSSIAGLDEPDGTESLDDRQILAGLHAKIYVVERNRRAHVFVGSANATEAAFGGNVEVLVELVGGATKLGVDTFLHDDAPFRSMLEPYTTGGGAQPDPLEEAQRALDDLLRDLATIPHTVTVTDSGPGVHTLTDTTDKPLPISDGYRVTLELLSRPGDAHRLTGGEPTTAAFAGVPLADVTPFLVVRATSPEGLQGGTVICGVLVNDPAGRLDEVLARQVDTPEKFLRFLALLLGLGNPHLLALLAGDDGAAGGGYARIGMGPGVFELVMRALADRPDVLADLDRLVSRLQVTEAGRKVLPEGFDQLWPVVIEAQRRLQEADGR